MTIPIGCFGLGIDQFAHFFLIRISCFNIDTDKLPLFHVPRSMPLLMFKSCDKTIATMNQPRDIRIGHLVRKGWIRSPFSLDDYFPFTVNAIYSTRRDSTTGFVRRNQFGADFPYHETDAIESVIVWDTHPESSMEIDSFYCFIPYKSHSGKSFIENIFISLFARQNTSDQKSVSAIGGFTSCWKAKQ